MIAWIKGRVMARGGNYAVVGTGGVGYKVFSPNLQSQVSSLELFTYHHIREDRQELYGFKTVAELEFFELLISVSGVGPKMALNIMSAGNLDKLRDSILKSDPTLLTAIGGVGKKIATKIVVELKSKLSRNSDINLATLGLASQELVDALQALGYQKREIAPIIQKLPGSLTSTQAKVTWALKQLTHSTG